ncbi:hypothetical protein ACHAWT_006706 [Skeletonema menzelii]|eukprot:scaffold2995_cov135-Skeletonema_menzelii.AAC.1
MKLSEALAPIDGVGEKVIDTTEEYVKKADDVILGRVMRIMDHAPAFVTLKTLADAGGISASLSSIVSHPETFKAAGLDMALDVPTMSFEIWTLICIFQALSLAKSALANNGNELSQSDITALAMSNWVAARAIGSENPLLDTIIVALVSGYALRNNGNASGDATIHNTSLQLMSSFTTVLSVLGSVAWVSHKIPLLADSASVVGLLGLASYHVMATREGNGTVKMFVNAGILFGMLLGAMEGGFDLSVTPENLMKTVSRIGTAYVAWEGIERFRAALMD